METKFNIGDWVYAVFDNQCIIYAQIKSIEISELKRNDEDNEKSWGIFTKYNLEFKNHLFREKYSIFVTDIFGMSIFATYEEALEYFKKNANEDNPYFTKVQGKRKK